MMKTVSLAVGCVTAIAALAFLALPGAGAPPAPKQAAPSQPLKLASPLPRNETQPSSMNQVQLTFAPVVKRIAPAVVNVYARSVAQVQVNPLFNDPFFSQFFGATPEMRQREYFTEKYCAPKCTVSCVQQVGILDNWRGKQTLKPMPIAPPPVPSQLVQIGSARVDS